MPIQRNRPEPVRATNAPVPSAEDVVGAFAGLTHDRLKDLLSSFVDMYSHPDRRGSTSTASSSRFPKVSTLLSFRPGNRLAVLPIRPAV
jgi:hypothetical protein